MSIFTLPGCLMHPPSAEEITELSGYECLHPTFFPGELNQEQKIEYLRRVRYERTRHNKKFT